jgi:hypothetical protein
VTVNTTVFAPSVAVQSAATFAVIVPAVLLIEVTVIPAGTVVAVTTRLPAAVSPSLAVAMVLAEPAVPRCRVKAAAAVIVGALLTTLSVKEASVVVPQLSVARIVMVCIPTGAALLTETWPDAFTLIVPV